MTDITATDLQDILMGPNKIEEYREQVTKRMKDDKDLYFLAVYKRCILQVLKVFPHQ